MEPEGSLLYSQVPATSLYPEPAQSSPYPTSHYLKFIFLKFHLNIILSSTPGSPQWSLSLRLPHQNRVNAALLPSKAHCATLWCHLYPVYLYHIFPHYLINGTIFGILLFVIKYVFWFSLQCSLCLKIFSFYDEFSDIVVYHKRTQVFK
jgi:hypothetical protein